MQPGAVRGGARLLQGYSNVGLVLVRMAIRRLVDAMAVSWSGNAVSSPARACQRCRVGPWSDRHGDESWAVSLSQTHSEGSSTQRKAESRGVSNLIRLKTQSSAAIRSESAPGDPQPPVWWVVMVVIQVVRRGSAALGSHGASLWSRFIGSLVRDRLPQRRGRRSALKDRRLRRWKRGIGSRREHGSREPRWRDVVAETRHPDPSHPRVRLNSREVRA